MSDVHLRPRRMRNDMKLDVKVTLPDTSMRMVRGDYMSMLRIVFRANERRADWRRLDDMLVVRMAYVNAMSIGTRSTTEVSIVSRKLRNLHELDRETYLQEQSDLGDAHADA